MNELSEIILAPIGEVRNEITKRKSRGWGNVESTMVINADLVDSLDGLEDFSHIIVIFWMHQSVGEAPVKVHPQRRMDLPLTGLFATRAPHRPNSIGVTVVKLLERSGATLKVSGLDAINGSPVLDLKPYLPKDSVAEARQPEWVSRLDQS